MDVLTNELAEGERGDEREGGRSGGGMPGGIDRTETECRHWRTVWLDFSAQLKRGDRRKVVGNRVEGKDR